MKNLTNIFENISIFELRHSNDGRQQDGKEEKEKKTEPATTAFID